MLWCLPSLVVSPFIHEVEDFNDASNAKLRSECAAIINDSNILIARIHEDRFSSDTIKRQAALISWHVSKLRDLTTQDPMDEDAFSAILALKAELQNRLDTLRAQYVPETDAHALSYLKRSKRESLSALRSMAFDLLARREKAGETFFSMQDKGDFLVRGLADDRLMSALRSCARPSTQPDLSTHHIQARKIAKSIWATVPYDNPECFLYADAGLGQNLQRGLAIFDRNWRAVEAERNFRLMSLFAGNSINQFVDPESSEVFRAVTHSVYSSICVSLFQCYSSYCQS